MTREEFTAMLAAEGFEPPVLVEREACGRMPAHRHPFEAKALILQGEIRIATARGDRTYGAGDVFHLAPNETHDEWYGPEGVTYLSGRRPPH